MDEDEEQWPHMLAIKHGATNEFGETTEEWWSCSCGATGTVVDPSAGSTWRTVWQGSVDHMVAVGQVS